MFAPGSHKHLLELNTLVLCGTSEPRRVLYARHLAATEHRFYEEPDGGISDLVEWSACHLGEPAEERAAGAYVRMLSTPQLFIEGNHRTGVLVMSYVLLRDGRPPLVLSAANADAFFEPSAAIRDIHQASPAGLFRSAPIVRRLAALLREEADHRYLLV